MAYITIKKNNSDLNILIPVSISMFRLVKTKIRFDHKLGVPNI